jgi:carbonic anhydrase
MSCPYATAPIDISLSTIKGKCDLKCSYSFHYNNSSCIATNRGDYLSISYDKSSSPPVLYNAVGYDVQEIRIYIPSLHSYNGSKSDGELIIVHTSNTGAKPLLVCIPIQSNNTTNESSMLLRTLIDTVASSAPSDGESTTVNLPKFNLEYLVPKKPFFSYSATEPYQPCIGDVDYIVYSPLQGSLDIMPDTLTKLQSIIMSNPYDVKTGPNLFFNDKGPSMGGGGAGEIYIDCQPVGSSDQSTEIIIDTGSSPYSATVSDWLNNPAVRIFLGSLLFIIILYVVKYLIGMIKPVKIEEIPTAVAELIKGGGSWRRK